MPETELVPLYWDSFSISSHEGEFYTKLGGDAKLLNARWNRDETRRRQRDHWVILSCLKLIPSNCFYIDIIIIKKTTRNTSVCSSVPKPAYTLLQCYSHPPQDLDFIFPLHCNQKCLRLSQHTRLSPTSFITPPPPTRMYQTPPPPLSPALPFPPAHLFSPLSIKVELYRCQQFKRRWVWVPNTVSLCLAFIVSLEGCRVTTCHQHTGRPIHFTRGYISKGYSVSVL